MRKIALEVTQSALVLNRGRIAYHGSSRELLPILSASPAWWWRSSSRSGPGRENHVGHPSIRLFVLAMTRAEPALAQDRYAQPRERMVAEIAAMARETGGAKPGGRDSAMRSWPRWQGSSPPASFLFSRSLSPTTTGRCLSAKARPSPSLYIVALMTDLLDPKPDHVVLEIGTGSAIRRPCSPCWWRRSTPSKSSSRSQAGRRCARCARLRECRRTHRRRP